MRVFVLEESPALSARLLERLEVVPGPVVVGVAHSVTEAVQREVERLVEYRRRAVVRHG